MLFLFSGKPSTSPPTRARAPFGLRSVPRHANMSPNGAAAVIERFADEKGIFLLFAGSRQLPHFHVQQDGTLERLIEDHGIVILDFIAWTDKKSELGEMILSRP